MINDDLLNIFRKVFHRHFDENNFKRDEIEEWDSLSHIKLIMELENEFNIIIDSDDIPKLYSDFNTVLEYIKNKITQ